MRLSWFVVGLITACLQLHCGSHGDDVQNSNTELGANNARERSPNADLDKDNAHPKPPDEDDNEVLYPTFTVGTIYDPQFRVTGSSTVNFFEVSAIAQTVQLQIGSQPKITLKKKRTLFTARISIARGTSLVLFATSSTGQTAETLPFAYLDQQPTLAPPPPPPTNVDVTFSINSSLDVHPISPWIYGGNMITTFSVQPTNRFLFDRVGGNRLTAYNWENNASNSGTDFSNSNDGFLGGGDTPGEAMRNAVAVAFAKNASVLMTVPIVGYVAADKNGVVNATNEANYLTTRFRTSNAAKNAAFTLTPNLSDGFVYQDEFVNFLETKFPNARTDPRRTIFYSLDNEPDLWYYTHPLLQSTHVSYSTLLNKTLAFAKAVKNVVPGCLIFGPVSYGWSGFQTLQSAPDSGANGDFINYYLSNLKTAEIQEGKRLVDVLDLHWYPEVRANGIRITTQDTSSAVVAARLQAPRSLWDDSYVESSFITANGSGPIRLIRRMQSKIATHYPNTKLAITEYYYGAGTHISGGIAQADVLGIFGRESVFAATMWRLGGTGDSFIFGAFDMYNNFDSTAGVFGNTSIRAQNPQIDQTSVYASVDQGNLNRMVIVVINKTAVSKSAQLNITHSVNLLTARVYQLTANSSVPQRKTDLSITNNSVVYVMPPLSVSTLVLTSP